MDRLFETNLLFLLLLCLQADMGVHQRVIILIPLLWTEVLISAFNSIKDHDWCIHGYVSNGIVGGMTWEPMNKWRWNYWEKAGGWMWCCLWLQPDVCFDEFFSPICLFYKTSQIQTFAPLVMLKFQFDLKYTLVFN